MLCAAGLFKNLGEFLAVNIRLDCEGSELGCSAVVQGEREILEHILPSMIRTSSAVTDKLNGER